MSSVTTSLTGVTANGLTSPTYTLADDSVSATSRKKIVTVLGGTQTGVTVHSASLPFYLISRRPQTVARLGVAGASGLPPTPRRNVWNQTVVKGITMSSSPLWYDQVKISIQVDAPAGLDVAPTKAEFAAAIAAAQAMLTQAMTEVYNQPLTNVNPFA